MNCPECDFLEPYDDCSDKLPVGYDEPMEFVAPEPTRTQYDSSHIEFSSLTPAERQAWVDFVAHEIERHEQDIKRSTDELEYIKKKWGIEPRKVYMAKWIEIK
jgi:hypothetical protein